MNGSSLSSEPPSPSPIPTGRGSRCAADPVFVEQLNRSVKIPKLSLPESVHRSVPAEIDRRLLVSRESDSANRFLLRSVVEFGVFLISGHGICVEELRSSFTDADVVFRMSDDREMGYCRHYGGCEEFVWRRYEAAVAETARKAMGADKYSTFREGIENVAKELQAIATELGRIIWESETDANNNGKQLISRRQGIEKQRESAVVSLYRYDHDDALTGLGSSLIPCFEQHDDDVALRLHLPLDHCEFHAQSVRGLLSFNASPQTIVVTIGKHFQGRSLGKFKPSFSLQLKYPLASTLTEDDGKNIISKTITVADQILFVIVIAFLYKVFVFMLC